MAIKRRQVWVIECTLCGREEVDLGNDDMIGFTLSGSWAGPAGGGPLGKVWICQQCVKASSALAALALRAMDGGN